MKPTKNLYLLLVLLIGSSLCCTSCEDTLTEAPDSYYTRKDFFTNASNARMAIMGIYNMLPIIYGDKDGQATPASDDTYYPAGGSGKDNTRRDIGHYVLTGSNLWIKSVWEGKYEQLNRANYSILNIEAMKGYAKDEVLHALVAEAKFLRAQAAFDLVRYWGDVPFKTTYSSNYENAYQPRTGREDIYEQVINDLSDAKKILPWAEAGGSPEQITQGAVRALLMRVLLTRAGYSLQLDGTVTRPSDELRQKYFKAAIKEWEAFEENGYHGFYEGGYEALFKGFSSGILNNKESLFEVAFYYPGAGGYWGSYMGPAVDAPNVSNSEMDKYLSRANGTFRAVPEWRSFYEADAKGNAIDKRRDIAICTYRFSWNSEVKNHVKTEDKSGRNWYPGKWRREWAPLGFKDLNSTDVNYCMLRYADVVLMAAEAYNETGDTGKAWDLLNRVRERAGATQAYSLKEYRAAQPNLYSLPYFNAGDAADDFRAALYWERGLELAFEGQRKYDLIRWGVLAESLQLFCNSTSVNTATSRAYLAGDNFRKGKHELFPIPLDEMQVNYKLEKINNPGY